MSDQLPLNVGDGKYTPPEVFNLIVALLEQVTSLSVIGEFLKKRGLPFSAGSWSDLKEKRLIPALRGGYVTIDDLVFLLSEVEEYGRCHTFLFKCAPKDAKDLISHSKVVKIANGLGLGGRIGVGQVIDQPEKPSIAAIRLEKEARGESLIIKVVEKRWEHVFLGEELVGRRLTRAWDVVERRAVNVVRLFDSGSLEIRIASRSGTSKYSDDIRRIRGIVEPFVPSKLFSEQSLAKTKKTLWEQQKQLKDKVRFSSSTLRDDDGTSLSAAAGTEGGDLMAHKGVTESVGAFLGNSGAYCETANFYWMAGKDGNLPSKEIHVILPELRNEFAIPANCSKADYEYVFDQLRALQK